MTPTTKALAWALVEALGKDEWYALMPADAEVAADRIRRRLKAKGYEVRPIENAESQRQAFVKHELEPMIEQAAEAVGREAAAPPSAAVDSLEWRTNLSPAEFTQALADAAALDVEALAAALGTHWGDHPALSEEGCYPHCAENIAAAYAAARDVDALAAFFDWAVYSPHWACGMEDDPDGTTRGKHLAAAYAAAREAAK